MSILKIWSLRADARYVMRKIVFILFIICAVVLLASEQDIKRLDFLHNPLHSERARGYARSLIKNSIEKYYKNQKVEFLHIHKMKNRNYLVIIRKKDAQERIVTNKKGKILSIIDDLSIVDGVEEGC